ncbi:MAG: DUF1385 domain-containing protein [Deltaproteobacteria bacterium]|nr:DUF1385 domain-containing protein [Deltaproteobacteria bacterium]
MNSGGDGLKAAHGPDTPVGGQAVVEGVMMRAPNATSVAVRKEDGSIVVRIRSARRIASRIPWLGRPGTRGIAVLLETMSDGISSLNFAAAQSMPESEGGEKTGASIAIGATMVIALAFGFFMFAVLPHALTLGLGALLGDNALESGRAVVFHLVDGIVKMLIFLAFMWGVSLMKDMRRVFEYHGAEHQAVHAFEAGLELTNKSLSRFPTAHPRCGTAFLITVIAVSIIVFAAVFPFMPVLFENRILNQLAYVLIKAPLVLPIASLSYELIRLASRLDSRWLGWLLSAPGVLFQKITTKQPDEGQREVAIVALKTALTPGLAGVGPGKPESVLTFADFNEFTAWVPSPDQGASS